MPSLPAKFASGAPCLIPSGDAPAPEMDDKAALYHWLVIYSHRNARTLRSYQTESLKFRRFLEHVHHDRAGTAAWAHLLKDASEEDLILYEQALQGNPDAAIPPGLAIIAAEAAPRGRNIFSRPLKRSSINLALTILHAMYEHFRTPITPSRLPYVLSNPASRLRSTKSRGQGQVERVVQERVISAMNETIRESIAQFKADGNRLQLARTIRQRWIFTLLFGVWGRRAEIASLRMSDFQRSFDGWEVRLQRKGGNEDRIALSAWVMEGLKAYRASLGMSPLPEPDDFSPAIAPLLDRGRRRVGANISEETIYAEVKLLAYETADRIRNRRVLVDIPGEEREYLLKQLKGFSPHWFRHTAATIAINGDHMTLEHASKMLGHAGTAVTASMYHHADRGSLRSGIDKMAGGLSL